ncbi:MAG: serine/threonine protein kinase [Eubacterium sp.]
MNSRQNFIAGRYIIVEEIGNGRSGVVYKAKDIFDGHEYAIKKYISIYPKGSKEAVFEAEREVSILKCCHHKALPRIYDIITHNNDYYLVMEYIKGQDLKSVISTKGAFTWKQTVDIIQKVINGLYFLHSLEPPVIYRDLKPSNIMLDSNGEIKLIDFGTAKRYSKEKIYDDSALGTRNFAAPEQYGSEMGRGLYNTDIRSDIYTVGTTMYYLLTGSYIKNGIAVYSWFAHRSIPAKLKRIINRCIQRNPDNRYQDDIQLLCDLYSLTK